MIFAEATRDFESWRARARALLAQGADPKHVTWGDPKKAQGHLFGALPQTIAPAPSARRVPKHFFDVAKRVVHHRDLRSSDVLYRVLWRLTHGERHLLDVEIDHDVIALRRADQQVRRDTHKTKAFVRFKKVHDTEAGEHFVAWHRPDHLVLPLVSDFFARRFRDMRWSILTPDESMHFDGRRVSFAEGVARRDAPGADALETLWRTYYRSIFIPSRLRIRAMRAEMPKKHWPTLPETALIPELTRRASEGALREPRSPFDALSGQSPAVRLRKATLSEIRAEASACARCPRARTEANVVFGEGPVDASLMIVGEQPGDLEDQQERPFVGPAGQLLDSLVAEAGGARSSFYVTNAVKHFGYTMSKNGKRRLHQGPGTVERVACRDWLELEVFKVKPSVLVCLGRTAMQAVVGVPMKISDLRGSAIESPWCPQTFVSWHPSTILRAPAHRAARLRAELTSDLSLAINASASLH